jgi:amino acid adenylation domain-containing protein/non-ribosomal peptide synthase protein (TIGR01720 family)
MLKSIQMEDRLNLFELNKGNLFRVKLIKENEIKYITLFSFHHTILDGWSCPLIFNFLNEIYLRLINNENFMVNDDEDFNNIQNYFQSSKNKNYNYWDKKIKEIEEKNDLKVFKNNQNLINNSNNEFKNQLIEIDNEKYIRLKKITLSNGLTLNALFQFIWHKIFSIYSNSNQTIIGTTLSGRNIPIKNIENAVGCFINTLPLIVNHQNNNINIIDKINEVQDNINEININSNVKLSKLKKNGEKLFEILLIFENYPEIKNEKLNELNINFINSIEKLDNNLNILINEDRNKKNINIVLNYLSNIFDETMITDTLNLFDYILTQIIENPNQKVSDLNYLIPSQEIKLLKEWNDTDMDYPEDKLINELFEETVEKYPNNIAVVYEEIELSYKELNEKSNQLSNYLRNNFNIKPDDIIALCLDKSELMIITILAVWKSGAAYVPMDPNFPDKRIEYILNDTQSKIIIANEIYFEKIKNLNIPDLKVILIDNNELRNDLNRFRKNNFKNEAKSNNLAYVLFTSGTTGLPKGVMIKYQSIIAYIFSQKLVYNLNYDNKFYTFFQCANYIFDLSVHDISFSLGLGCKLLIVNKKISKNNDKLSEIINKNIDFIFCTPTFFETIKIEKDTRLKIIEFGGEKFRTKFYDILTKKFKIQIINAYGTTETTISSTTNQVNEFNYKTIGKPFKNEKCYVLNKELKPVPIGAIGELHIGGAGLARGYLNKPELTKEKFIPNPFQTDEEKKKGKNSRIYKTGDLVRWLPDGNLDYIGRNDFQVKIRGFRIELEEIESVLLEYEGIKQSVVLAKERKKENDESIKYLVGYYVSDIKLDESKIMNYLKQKLAEYMVPSLLIHLDKLPITINGKLDTKALPERDIDIENNYIEPRNELELKIQQIFSNVLGIEKNKISIKDDFFMLGGDSIVSIQLVSKIRETLGYTISIKDIFKYKTIELLYDNVIINESNKKEIKSEQGILNGEFELLPIQKWFLNSNYENKNYFNQSFMIKVPKLNINKLKLSIKILIEQHDSLRLKFKKDINNKYYQYYDENININLNELDIKSINNDKDLNDILTEWQNNFNIENGPLYNCAYLYGYDDDSCRLWFAFHHLIIDTVSWRIILDDLKRIYNDEKLSFKGTSYRQWIDTINNYNSNEKEYWLNILNDFKNNNINSLQLFDKNTNNYETFELNEKQTDILLRQCNKTFNTNINDILLTALSYTLSELTNNDKNYILLEGHGREDIDDTIDITKTIGWFTSMYPVCLYKKDDLSECLIVNKENLRLIPNKGVLFGKYFDYNKNNDLPKISFNYLGQFDNIKNFNDLWSFTNDISGNNVSNKNENNIDINSNCINNIFQCVIQSNIKDFTIRKLFLDNFKKNILKLIDHCIYLKRSYLTSSDVNYIIDNKYLDILQKEKEIDNIFKTNNLHDGFIYNYLNEKNDSYLMQNIFEYNTSIRINKLLEAWKITKKRFKTLRSRFSWENKLIQIIDKYDENDNTFFEYIELDQTLTKDKIFEMLKSIQMEDRLNLFELNKGNLFRVKLIKENEIKYITLFSFHHTILDGWSCPLIFNFLNEIYLRLINNENFMVNDDEDFNNIQNYFQSSKNKNYNYWDKKIKEIEEKNDLKVFKNNQNLINNSNNEFKNQLIEIDNEKYIRLKKITLSNGLTLNALFQFIWHKIFSIYSNSNQTIIGTTLSGRNIPIKNIENAVGCFINTLPLIVNHQNNNINIIDKINEVQDNINEININSNVKLSKLKKNGEKLFEILLIFENYPEIKNEKLNELNINFINSIEKLDNNLNILINEDRNKKNINIVLNYLSNIFDETMITDTLNLFDYILTQIIENPNQKVSDLNYLIPSQEIKLLKEWNDTDMDYPEDKLINELFEETVEKYPNNIAVVYEEIELSYKELNEKSNQLSNYLRNNFNIKPDDIIALCLDKSELMIITILAVWKSGAAYVPMDPNFPDKRIEYILNDTQSKIIIANEIYFEKIKNLNIPDLKVILIDNNELRNDLNRFRKNNFKNEAKSNNLAYVLFTSGTTGLPKGVMIEIKNILLLKFTLNLIIFSNNCVDQTFLQISNYVFDISIQDFILSLLNGIKLVLISNLKLKKSNDLFNFIIKHKITYVQATPSILNTLSLFEFPDLNYLLFIGEKINKEHIKSFVNNTKKSCKILNTYGPTETTIVSSVSKDFKKLMSDSIGNPIANYKCYVLNKELKPVPIGAIGELHIGGAGLARGYLNKPELTKEKFIPNPFQTDEEKKKGKNSRIYKTGDLVRWLPDGNLDYIGRNDFQVKIRGFRIELEEIESVLLEYEGIKQSVVLAKERKKENDESIKYLVGYYVSDIKLDESKIMNYLKQKLAEYMVPCLLIHLDKLPITINGKLDTKALPERDIDIENNYIEPRNELELKIQQIFSNVLGIEKNKISIKDDFFMLGGDSIVSIQLVSKIRETLGYTISIKDIFKYKTIELLYDNVIINESNKKEIKSEQGILNGEFELLPIQKWFLNSNYENKNYFNQSFMIKVPKLNINKLKLSIKILIEQHDSLRLKFKKDINNKYYQYYDENININLNELDIKSINNDKDLNDILTEWQNNFNIENGPLYNCAYLYGYDDDSCRLWFAFHHLIIDTVSWRIILDDLKRIYNDEKLSFKGTSYRQWIDTINNYNSNEKEYWLNILNDFKNNNINSLQLFDKNTNNYETFELNEKQTDILLRQCNKTFNTNINDILLTALSYTLSELTNNDKNYILLEGHGREDIDDTIDITKTIGWFTSMYPVCLYKKDDLSECLIVNKENLRLIPNKGVLFGKYFDYNKNNDLPKISFNYLGQFDNIKNFNDLWSFTNDISGNNVSNKNENNIDINSNCINNIFQCVIQSNIKDFTIRKLFLDNFKKNILKLIDHCIYLKRSYLTSSDVNYIIDNKYLDILQKEKEIDNIFKTNNLHDGFIYNYLNEKNDSYLMQNIFEYNTSIRINKLLEAWKITKKRFKTLRSRFSWENKLIQIIDKYDENDNTFFEYIELDQTLTKDKIFEMLKSIQMEDRLNLFELNKGNLFRVKLIKENEIKYITLFSFHHTILDGWSCPLIFNFLNEIYLRLINNENFMVNDDEDFNNIQNYFQSSKNKNYNYWDKKIKEIEEKNDLKVFKNNQNLINNSNNEFKNQLIEIDNEKYIRLKKITLSNGLTLNALFQFIWHKIFSIYSNSNQTIIGTTLSGRNIPIKNIENAVGCFINTLPLIVNHQNNNINIIDKINEVQDNINEININSNVKLSKLKKNGEKLFEILLIFENYPEIKNEKLNELNINFINSIEKLDNNLNILINEDRNKKNINIVLNYLSNIFDETMITDTLNLFDYILTQIIENPNQKVSDLNYLIPSQEIKLLKEWNDTDMDYPEDKLINELFEETVEKYPNNIAVVYEEIELSYKELNEKSNQLSNYLRNNFNIKPDDIIALCLDKSELMIITILAVWKSGAAYVPMDPNFPDKRIEYILNDTQSKIIIANEIYFEKIKNLNIPDLKVILIDNNELRNDLNRFRKNNFKNEAKSNNLAYSIYTSGTTGLPKGVLIENKNIISYTLSLSNKLFEKNLFSLQNILQISSYVFDISIQDILLAYFNGFNLIIPNKNIFLAKNSFKKLILQKRVTFINTTPTLLKGLDNLGNTFVKYLLIGGEKLNYSIYNTIISKIKNECLIVNIYGLTETTVFLSLFSDIAKKNLICIGKPLNNYKCYVLNKELKPVPIGAIGELHIGGAGLARGYLNKPELTNEKFIPNPFQTDEEKKNGKNSRIYKTGDLVRWLPDGNLDYIGRNDFQVKIRGFRIELEEIESVLLEYEGIKQSVVLAKERKKENDESIKYLVGYYVSDIKLDESKIMNYLKQKLAEYMVPSLLIHLDKLPITINGKLDTKALPDRDIDIENNYIEPRNELELKIQQIYSTILGIEKNKISIKDDFFMLGGDSIVSIQLVSKIRETLGYTISIKDIFKYKTIELLYDNVIINESNKKEIKSEQGILNGEFELLPIQKWFLNSNYENKNYFNQSFMIKVPKLNINKLKLSIKILIEQHDSLRLKFKKDINNKYYQYYDENININLNELDIKSINNDKDLNDILTEWQNNFNIENGPLYNCAYLYGYDDDSCRLWFAFHHLIIDTVSWRIILDDLKRIYNDEKLSFKGTSYRQWIDTINNYNSNEKEYWLNILNDFKNNNINSLQLFDKNTNNYETFELNEKQTDILLRQCNKTFNTNINDILLTALSYTLSELTNNDKNYILLEGHGREDIDDTIDITKTIGWFTSMYPVCLYKKDDLSECLIVNKENLRLIPNKGVLFGKYFDYNKNNDLPKISFNYLGQFDNIKKYNDFWSFTNDISGNNVLNKNENYIIINFFKINGILIFNLESNLFNSNLIFQKYKSNLILLILHIKKFKRSFITSSDIDFIIDQNRINYLQTSSEIDFIFNLNNIQEGFIYHYLKVDKTKDTYFNQAYFEINSSIEPTKFIKAWESAKKKFSALRTRFSWNDKLIQIIDKYEYNSEFIKYIELDKILDEKEIDSAIQEFKIKDRLNFFKLDEGNLFRILLAKINENKYFYLISYHHTILDGWSISILNNFVYERYLNLIDNEETEEIDKDNDFNNAQKFLQKTTNYEYWNLKLNEIEDNIDLKIFQSIDSKNSKLRKNKIELLEIKNDKYLNLKKLNSTYSITPNALFQFIWHKIFSIYSNSNQTIIGTTLSGRNIPIKNIENAVGCFINTLPLIVNHQNNNINIIDKINEIQDKINELNIYSNVKLSKLKLNNKKLFEVLLIFENYPEIKNDKIDKLNIKIKDINEQKELDFDVPIIIIVDENIKSFSLQLSYNNEIDCELITDTLNLFDYILTQIIENPNQKVSDLNYLIPSQEIKLLKEWNDTDMDYPEDKLINELFEETVEKYPNNIAVVYEEIELSYKELNEKSNQLSNYLRNNFNIKPDDIIALCLDKSELMIITILAVWKSGAAYVPMDPNFPDKRIEYILNDTQSKIIIANEIYFEKIKNLNIPDLKVILIDNNELRNDLNRFRKNNFKNEAKSNNLAYVLFTSGTTGLPKGVMIEIKNILLLKFTLNLIIFSNNCVDQTFLQISNYVFDISIQDFILSLLNGIKLVLISNLKLKKSNDLFNFIIKHKITYVQATPSILNTLSLFEFPDLNYLLFIGEKINKEHIKSFVNNTKKSCKILNTYGPTETTIVSSVSKDFKKLMSDSIGNPIANYKCYVLNKELKPVPIGAIGELHIGGAGLARGYLNKPELTNEKFIPNPFQTDEEKKNGKNSRIYKTGDLVRWLPDGNLDYIGRNDFQVKIRGFRIELEEIESVLLEYEGIKQSVVLAKERKKENDESIKYLVGYYVSDIKLDESKIMNYLKQKLAEYMVPSLLIHLDKLPITINGKLDTKALPDRDIDIENNYIEPRNELELKIQQIYSTILGIEKNKISIKDDFFMLGGDSIVSIQLVSKIRETLGYTISIKDIFKYKTIELLYDNVIINESNKKEIKSEQGILNGEFELLPIQKWFLNSNYENKNYFNQSFMIKVPKLNINKLKLSIKILIEQHDSLRLKFKKDINNKYYQYYDENININLNELDIKSINNDKDLNDILTEWQNNFNIENGPLYNCAYLYGYDDDSCRLWFAFHHLIIDTVSWRIILDDLKRIYNDEKLSFKGTSYRQWIDTINNYNSNEKEYWLNILNDFKNNNINSLQLFDKNTNNYETFELNEKQTDILLRQCNKTFNTNINDILLTALSYTLSELTNNDKNYILLEGHGREDIDDTIDITKTIGWFTSMYPVCLYKKDDLSECLIVNKENLRLIPNKGVLFGKYFDYNKNNDLPKISFNYLGQFDNIKKYNDFWSFTNDISGNNVLNKNENYIIINFFKINGILIFNLESNLFNSNLIFQKYKSNLILLILHIKKFKRSFITSSDIDFIIDQNRINYLQTSSEIDFIFNLNNIQEGFIYHYLKVDKTKDTYFNQAYFEINSSIEPTKFIKAWESAKKKFSALRTRFSWNDKLIQIIDKYEYNSEFIKYIELDKILDEKEIDSAIQEFKIKDRLNFFKLDEGNLFRILLAKINENKYFYLISYHHTILDGWSIPILNNFVYERYLNLIDNEETEEIDKDNDFNNAQKFLQKTTNYEYWNLKLNEIEDNIDLKIFQSIDSKNSKLRKNKIELLEIKNDKYLNLKKLNSTYSITPNALFQFIWHKIFSIYSNSNQTIIGTTLSGRNIPIKNIENAVGCFINTLPLIVNHQNNNINIIDKINEIQDKINELNIYSNVKLSKLKLNNKKLFEVLLIFENYPEIKNDKIDKLNIKIKDINEQKELDFDVPIIIIVDENIKSFSLQLSYNNEIDCELITDTLNLFDYILTQIIENPNQKVSDLNYLIPSQEIKLLKEWNDTDMDYPEDKLINELFEETVEKYPNNIAVVYEEIELSYKELNEKSNQLSNYLRNNFNIKPDDIIALCLDKSELMIITILAVWKSGAAYVPMDPNFPDKRIEYILNDTQSKIIIANEIYFEKIKNLNIPDLKVILIDNNELRNDLNRFRKNNFKNEAKSNNLAYVLFTSGTTGLPKGVMINKNILYSYHFNI